MTRPGTYSAVFYTIAAVAYLIFADRLGVAAGAILKVLPLVVLAVGLSLSLKGASDRTAIFFCLAALTFSALGDIAGETTGRNAFFVQIACFAVAQTIYFFSFLRFCTLRRNDYFALRTAAGAAVPAYIIYFARLILPAAQTVALRWALGSYSALIGIMAIGAVFQKRKHLTYFIIGALSFVISDSLLAYNSFIGHISFGGFAVMATYYTAQLCLNVTLMSKTI